MRKIMLLPLSLFILMIIAKHTLKSFTLLQSYPNLTNQQHRQHQQHQQPQYFHCRALLVWEAATGFATATNAQQHHSASAQKQQQQQQQEQQQEPIAQLCPCFSLMRSLSSTASFLQHICIPSFIY
jgi:predicted metal-binding membrane protein